MNTVFELRRRKGMQQKVLALLVGVSVATVSEWEHNKKDPSGERLEKLCEVFETTPSVIFGYDPISPENGNGNNVRTFTNSDLKFALFEGCDDITDDDLNEVKRFAKYILAKRKGIIG